MLPLVVPLLAWLAVGRTGNRPPKAGAYLKTDHVLLERIRQDDGLVWVDLENVRGKTGFALSHLQVLEQTAKWTSYHNLTGHVVVAADHGSVSTSYFCQDWGMGIIFSGNHRKADDVLAQSVGLDFLGESIVITADSDLQSRCRRAAKKGLHIWDPAKFLDDVEATMAKIMGGEIGQDGKEAEASPELSLEEQVHLGKLDDEIRLRAQILDLQVQIDGKKRLTNKRRKKLQTKLNSLQSKLALKGPSILDQVTSIQNSDETGMSSVEQDLLLQRWKKLQSQRKRKEQTGDRVVLAEELRRQLVEMDGVSKDLDDTRTPAETYVSFANGNAPADRQQESKATVSSSYRSAPAMPDEDMPARIGPTTLQLLGDKSQNPLVGLDTVRIVAISDTHGFEGQLLEGDSVEQCDILPEGDILLHLGDFAYDGNKGEEQQARIALDQWLAKQPHPMKIVVRGNHDPWRAEFRQSGAWYITKPMTVSLQDNLSLGVIPYGNARTLSASKSIPSGCDVLATHVPPMKVLDRTCTGKHAGSDYLVKTVREMGADAPSLWLCGHIHEGRGIAERKFHSSASPTTVVNAANANGGRATHLEHGAVVVEIEAKDTKEKAVSLVSMDDKTLERRVDSSGFYERDSSTPNGLLLAVDLGLKSGVSLLNQKGQLLRYEQFLFEKENLGETVKHLLQSWEARAQEEALDSEGSGVYHITHLAIEGADGYMLRAWADAAPDLSILRVSPEEWRSELLLPKEKLSGSDAKAASRLIARQVVEDFGVMQRHEGKFPTDVAEAVCLGMYVSRKLNWIQRDIAVRRYTNGKIVVPKK